MGNIVLGVSSNVAFYFQNLNQTPVDALVDQYNGSAKDAADAEGGIKKLVVDIITIGNITGGPYENFDYLNGQLFITYEYCGLTSSKLKRHPSSIDLSNFKKGQLLTTVVTLIEKPQSGSIPTSDSASDTTSIPLSDDDVPGKGVPD